MNTWNDFEEVSRLKSPQSRKPTGSNPSNLEAKFICAVCLEVFAQPTIIPCGHTFCSKCLDSCVAAKPVCPVCRVGFNPRRRRRADSLEEEMQATVEPCPDCKIHFLVSELRRHAQLCLKRVNQTAPAVATAQHIPKTVPNRSTFSCPYCESQNLDYDALLFHVNNTHKLEKEQVVCPICASMPWGNPHQKSGNFLEHLNRRHKFEYDTFVDFERSEDDVFKDVLAQSMQEQ